MRPANPMMAVKRANDILRQQEAGEITGLLASHLFNKMLGEQDYQFKGALSVSRKYILDSQTGGYLGKVEPGDSFIGWNDLTLEKWEKLK